ncbi:hypothetical protein OAN62_04280 [Gammaproteobacteria bacterium]|nr:hypothetical protein [Gammaproteobacteria bacterium]
MKFLNKESMLEKVENVDEIKFVKRYGYNGATKPQVELGLKEADFRR